jgi:hypothetical protein
MRAWELQFCSFAEEREFYMQYVAVWDCEVSYIECSGDWINIETGTEVLYMPSGLQTDLF